MEGIFNLNVIGAYIITLLILGILIQGPKLVEISTKMEILPGYVHSVIFVLLVFIALQSLQLYEFGSFLAVPYLAVDWMNFLIHEAGHIYFMFLGRFFHVLGGTLTQLGLPFILVYRCYRNKYLVLLVIMIFWFGLNFTSISRYVADARSQKLDTFGGEHDWTYILSQLGLLEYDLLLSRCIWLLGLIIMASALTFYGRIIFRRHL